MSGLEHFGVSGDQLPAQAKVLTFLPAVAGRVAHIDADFMSYQVSAETKNELDGIEPRRTLDHMKEHAEKGLINLMKQCGATSYVAHITPTGSDKGGRDDHAMTLPYQGNRKDRDGRPEHLDAIRAFIGEELPSVVHLTQEADDGMTQANVAARDSGDRELSVIVSKDKDLRMAPGLHWDFADERIVDVETEYGDEFGGIYLDQHELPSGKMSPKSCKGWGTKFFWAQLLMGDTADHIKGLPSKWNGTKSVAMGQVGAFKELDGLKTDRECYDHVLGLYLASKHEWLDYRNQLPITASTAFLGDARTLWMRQYADNDDLIRWFRATM